MGKATDVFYFSFLIAFNKGSFICLMECSLYVVWTVSYDSIK